MAESIPWVIQVGAEKAYWLSRTLQAESQIADLTRERNSLALQLDSCQGALREVIVENSANCDRAEWLEQQIAENTHSREEIERFRKETIDRAETAETALAEARQHIVHLEDQLADAETARTLALGIAERAEQERDEAKALIDRTGAPTIRGG